MDIQPDGVTMQPPAVLLPNLDIKTTTVITIKEFPAVLLPSLDMKPLPIIHIKAVILLSLDIKPPLNIKIKAVLELGVQTDPQEGNVTTAAAEDRHNILFK